MLKASRSGEAVYQCPACGKDTVRVPVSPSGGIPLVSEADTYCYEHDGRDYGPFSRLSLSSGASSK